MALPCAALEPRQQLDLTAPMGDAPVDEDRGCHHHKCGSAIPGRLLSNRIFGENDYRSLPFSI
jgi:hypothetical protein